MDGKEIFDEILKSSRLKELIGINENDSINEDFESTAKSKEIAIIRIMIEGQNRRTSDENIFKNITKLYDM